jgi:hypothetical protein
MGHRSSMIAPAMAGGPVMMMLAWLDTLRRMRSRG